MVINFFGRRGSGKTTAIRGNLWAYRRPVVIIDVLGNFENEEFFNTTDSADAIEALREYRKNRQPEIICLKTADPEMAVEYISVALWEMHGGTLVLDEVDSIPITEGSAFDQLIRYGRNHNVDLITGCRRPAELSKNITAAANKMYCFATHEFRDIEYFRSVFGDYAEKLLRTPRFHGIYIDYDANVRGEFSIDTSGNIFHAQEESLHEGSSEREFSSPQSTQNGE